MQGFSLVHSRLLRDCSSASPLCEWGMRLKVVGVEDCKSQFQFFSVPERTEIHRNSSMKVILPRFFFLASFVILGAFVFL